MARSSLNSKFNQGISLEEKAQQRTTTKQASAKYASLNSKFNGVAVDKFIKSAGSMDILKTLFGKAPSSAIADAATVSAGGRAAGESLMDSYTRQALVNMEKGRRKGALSGMGTGIGIGGIGGAVGVPSYLGREELSKALAALDNVPAGPEFNAGLSSALADAMAAHPMAALLAGGTGAAAGGYIGKRVGGAMGRAKGLMSTSPTEILKKDLETQLLRRM